MRRLGKHAHEVERGRIGPVQIFEGEHIGCDRAPARIQADRLQLPAPHSSGANAATRPRPKRNRGGDVRVDVEHDSRRYSRDQQALVVGDRRRRTPGRPLHDRMQRRFCKSCEDAHPTMWGVAELGDGVFDGATGN